MEGFGVKTNFPFAALAIRVSLWDQDSATLEHKVKEVDMASDWPTTYFHLDSI